MKFPASWGIDGVSAFVAVDFLLQGRETPVTQKEKTRMQDGR